MELISSSAPPDDDKQLSLPLPNHDEYFSNSKVTFPDIPVKNAIKTVPAPNMIVSERSAFMLGDIDPKRKIARMVASFFDLFFP